MAGHKPGPLCSSRLGQNWIDNGTLCRSRSSPPGPLGIANSLLNSLIMGAVPKEDSQLDADARAMFAYDIDVIAESPFGGTAEGQDIVKLLRSYNDGAKIVYGKTLEDDRGDWDGQTIRINDDYRANMYRTIPELVHEASHALWRTKRKSVKGEADNKRNKNNADDELHAQENQLKIYKYLKDKFRCPQDELLERRLRAQADGKLKKSIEERFGM